MDVEYICMDCQHQVSNDNVIFVVLFINCLNKNFPLDFSQVIVFSIFLIYMIKVSFFELIIYHVLKIVGNNKG